MRKYKYKREHFETQEEYNRFRYNRTKWQKEWLARSEKENPERRERRLLRQRFYSRYYYHTDCSMSFGQWLLETYGIEDLDKYPKAFLVYKLAKVKLNENQ